MSSWLAISETPTGPNSRTVWTTSNVRFVAPIGTVWVRAMRNASAQMTDKYSGFTVNHPRWYMR
jgi:hypothetical protein